MAPRKRQPKDNAKFMPAIGPNTGEYLELARKLRYFYNSELKAYKRACLNAAKEYLQQVKIDNAALPPFEVHINELIERQFKRSSNAALQELSTIAIDSGEPPYLFSLKYAEAAARYRIEHGTERARDVSYWFCRKLLRNINHRMKRELKAAGVSTAWLAKRWSVPVIGGQSMAPAVAAGLPKYIDGITGLITKMSQRSHQKVQEALVTSLTKGLSVGQIAQVLSGLENMDAARAQRVARDQTSKLNEFVQRENYKSLGIRKARWIHVPGQFTSRDTHKNILDGQTYDMDKGLFDPDPKVNDYIHPGELPFCRCTFRALLPDFLTRED